MGVINLLLFNGSRKVGFGLWLFIVASSFLLYKYIDAKQWEGMIIVSATLVGGGTVADRYLTNGRKK